jgi:hypothetical protein
MKRRLSWALALFSFLPLFSEQPRPDPDLLDVTLLNLAGKNALNCGRGEIWSRHDAVDKCVLKSAGALKQFYARYASLGIDTEEWIGFAGDRDGSVFEAAFSRDSHPYYWVGIDLGRIKVKKCPKPSRFHNNYPTIYGLMTCLSDTVN